MTKPCNKVKVKGMIRAADDAPTSKEEADKDFLLGAKSGDVSKMAQAIAYGADMNASDGSGNTAAMFAACFNRIEALEFVVQLGANLDERNAAGDYALLYAVSGYQMDALELLLRSGVNVDNAHPSIGTAAMYASRVASSDALAMLIRAGADLGLCDMEGWTAATNAAHGGSLECALMLERAGADMSRKDMGGCRPIDHVHKKNCPKLLAFFKAVEERREMIESQAGQDSDLALSKPRRI